MKRAAPAIVALTMILACRPRDVARSAEPVEGQAFREAGGDAGPAAASSVVMPIEGPLEHDAARARLEEITFGEELACARTSNGRVRCLRAEEWEPLLSPRGRPRARRPIDDLSGAIAIAAGRAHACALLADRTVRCWGDNHHGQLGDGTLEPRAGPVAVLGLTTVERIAVGADFGCALLDDGGVRCWGDDTMGQLGIGVPLESTAGELRAAPREVEPLGPAADLAAGRTHACAALQDGAVMCWGDNGNGQLGVETPHAIQPLPVVVQSAARAVQVAAGDRHTCARTDGGDVLCWGANGGALGDGGFRDSAAPATIAGLARAVSITAGGGHTCARGRGGRIACTGMGSRSPVVLHALRGARALAIGGDACGLLDGGVLTCIGDDGKARRLKW